MKKINKGLKKYLINTIWQFFEKFFALFVSFIVGLTVARYLGKEQYGILGYAQSLVGLFACIADFGINEILNRELVKKEKPIGHFLGTASVIKLIGGILALSGILATGYFLNLDTQTLLLVFILGTAYLFHTVFVLQFYFKSKILGKQLFWVSFFANIFSATLKFLFVFFELDLIYFGVALLSESIMMAALYYHYYYKLGENFSDWKYDSKIATLFLREGWPLILSTIMVTVFMRVDQIMIKHILGNASNGLYNATVKLSELWYTIPVVICNSIFPSMVKSKQVDISTYNLRIQSLFSFMFWIALVIIIVNYVFADLIFDVTYGEQYLSSAAIYRIHIFSSIFMFFVITSTRYLQIEKLTKQVFYRSVLGAISNILLNIVLIPKYGLSGAAYATLISYGIISYYPLDLFNKKLFGLFKMKIKAMNPFYAINFLKSIYSSKR
ncbi:flippase [Flavivirga abyssicola]|uniref:flippase n=1 Tax=Flavivirga abyssicola TaxID=3063533 RepID=UPI0026DF57E4|nr:flippase [Flavivirga sp. MEBiC07777]WVK14798.1 flippase [Flavivirga sp. MEBiC07777]